MTLDEIIALPLERKNILIIGKSASGKTFLSNLLKEKGHYVIHTDKFLGYPSERKIMQEITEEFQYCQPCVIEGMWAYKLLYLWELAGKHRPNIIINCEISAGKQREVYLKERDASKLQYQKRFWTKCLSLYQEWEKIVQNKPQIITYERD